MGLPKGHQNTSTVQINNLLKKKKKLSKTVIYIEIDILLQKGFIKKTDHESQILISSTFIQPKHDDGLNEV